MNISFFVESVKSYCQVKGVSLSKACIESGAGKSLIDNVKRGRVPSVDSIQLLARYLGVTTSDLLGEEKIPTPENGSGRDEEEQEIIRLWSQLTQDQKKLLRAWLQTALGEDT